MTLKLKRKGMGKGTDTMAMIEPTLNWEEFLKDLDDGMSAYNLQEKHILTPRQYRWIMRRIVRKDGYSLRKSGIQKKTVRFDTNEPYISMKRDGHFIIRKKKIYYGQYNTLETAKAVKEKLIEAKWDKRQLNKIRTSMGLEPMTMYKEIKQ